MDSHWKNVVSVLQDNSVTNLTSQNSYATTGMGLETFDSGGQTGANLPNEKKYENTKS